MVKSFRHKGLESFFRTGSKKGIQANHAGKLRMVLSALDTAYVIEDVDLPGYRLHPLKGKRQSSWSVKISGNWRITFQFFDGNVYFVNYEDYH